MKNIYENKYSEGRNYEHKVKSWAIALETPYEEFNETMIKRLHIAASNWEICACGNLCKSIPRVGFVPKDSELAILGGYFGRYVIDMKNNFISKSREGFELSRKLAINTHRRIENRAWEILNLQD